jgi:hypothetical protein
MDDALILIEKRKEYDKSKKKGKKIKWQLMTSSKN